MLRGLDCKITIGIINFISYYYNMSIVDYSIYYSSRSNQIKSVGICKAIKQNHWRMRASNVRVIWKVFQLKKKKTTKGSDWWMVAYKRVLKIKLKTIALVHILYS